MTRLIAARCPACNAGVSVDPDVEYHQCSQCGALSFVRSPARIVPPEVNERGAPVITLSGGYAWTLPVTLVGVTLALGIAGYSLLHHVDVKSWTSQTSNGVPATLELVQSTAPRVNDIGPHSTSANDIRSPHGNGSPGVEPSVPQEKPTASNGSPGVEPSVPQEKPTASNGARLAAQSAAPTIEKSTASKIEGRAPPAAKTPAGKVTAGQITVSGRSSPDGIRKVVGAAYARFRMCYERGLRKLPTLSGRISVRFVVGRDGSVSNASVRDSSLTDPDVVACVVRSFYGLQFTPPESGIVTVVYPLQFRTA